MTTENKASSQQRASAMEDLTIPEVRKCLNILRERWREGTISLGGQVTYNDKTPEIGPNKKLLQDFCFDFVVGIHKKRIEKNKKNQKRKLDVLQQRSITTATTAHENSV